MRLTAMQHHPSPLVAFLVLLSACTSAATPPSSRTPAMTASASPIASPSPTSPPTLEPLPARTNGRLIAYVAGVDPQIFLLDLETGQSRQLTRLLPAHAELAEASAMRPVISCAFGPSSLAWSPDGQLLAFAYGGCDGVVWLVDLDGTLQRVGDGRSPTWAPDGERLVYASNVPWDPCGGCVEPGTAVDFELQVYEVASGPPARPLTADGTTSRASMPRFSPRADMLAYAGRPSATASPETFVATYVLRTGDGESLWIGDGIHPYDWDTSGRLLVVREADGALLAIDVASGDATLLTDASTTSVAPDGSLVLTYDLDPVTGGAEYHVSATDGALVTELSSSVVAWAPDSTAFAVHDEAESVVRILGRDGSLEEVLSVEQSGVSEAAWQPGP